MNIAARSIEPEKSFSAHDRAYHVLSIAKNLARASAAALVLVRNGTSRVILSSGTESENASFVWPNDYLPYDPGKSHILVLGDKVDIVLARAVRSILGDYRSGTFVRLPVILEPNYAVAMVMHCSSSAGPPCKSDMDILKAVSKSLAVDIHDIVHMLVNNSSCIAVPFTTSELVARVRNSTKMRILLDGKLKLVAFSPAVADSNLVGWGNGKHDIQLFPRVVLPNSLRLLIQHAIESGVSSPVVEMASQYAGHSLAFTVRATPLSAIDADSELIELAFNSVFGEKTNLRADGIGELLAADAAGDFLFETLVAKRSLKNRGNYSYVALRSWRAGIKKHQILALRSIKKVYPGSFAIRVGQECAQEIKKLVGSNSFKYVVPIPCGHSAPDKCLSSAIAREVGRNLGMLNINAFAHLDVAGSSHPKENLRRPAMQMVQNVPGPAILIDDVTTSGSHIVEATEKLAQSGVESFAVSWIGGESA